jgi:hypothetical protein
MKRRMIPGRERFGLARREGELRLGIMEGVVAAVHAAKRIMWFRRWWNPTLTSKGATVRRYEGWILSPRWGLIIFRLKPRAYAVGFILAPLRGWDIENRSRRAAREDVRGRGRPRHTGQESGGFGLEGVLGQDIDAVAEHGFGVLNGADGDFENG